ncbi:hypothetical protein [Lactobacillus terrae]|uniref:hypothetical protein n=1 Tax=Lactobacillus terrae TaxID=2269374 RepID=UPI001475CEF9|nr:hypothetical protein [Lactobacillus terrae]
MNNFEWVKEQLQLSEDSQSSYLSKSFVVSLENLFDDIEERKQQYEYEIDGKLWDHGSW